MSIWPFFHFTESFVQHTCQFDEIFLDTRDMESYLDLLINLYKMYLAIYKLDQKSTVLIC